MGEISGRNLVTPDPGQQTLANIYVHFMHGIYLWFMLMAHFLVCLCTCAWMCVCVSVSVCTCKCASVVCLNPVFEMNIKNLNNWKQFSQIIEKKMANASDGSTSNELWHIWLGGGKGYFRHSSKLFYIKGIAVGQPPISYHFWVCWWTSFFENLRPLRLEVAEICWGCWKQPQAHKKCFHNKNLVF